MRRNANRSRSSVVVGLSSKALSLGTLVVGLGAMRVGLKYRSERFSRSLEIPLTQKGLTFAIGFQHVARQANRIVVS